MNNITKTEQTEELAVLKAQADALNIHYHPNIGFKTLQARVNEQLAIEAQDTAKDPVVDITEPPATSKLRTNKGRQMTAAEFAEARRRSALKLVRVRVACMNPNKKDWDGEIFSIGNSQIPTQKKYVPFNIAEGWHIPQIMVNWLQTKQYQMFITVKDSRGREIREGIMKNEFAVEILPPLTKEEFSALKLKQALAAGKT